MQKKPIVTTKPLQQTSSQEAKFTSKASVGTNKQQSTTNKQSSLTNNQSTVANKQSTDKQSTVTNKQSVIKQQAVTYKQVEKPIIEKFKPKYKDEVSLQNILPCLEIIWQNDKIPMIFDVSQNFANFLTYKGNKIDVAEYVIAQAINKTNKDEFLEKTRKSFYYSMKMGSLLGIFLDKMNTKLPELYKDCAWFEQDKLMKPSELMTEEFYKKKILKEEEDVDSFGNKGHFEADKNFKFFILLNGDRLEEYTQQCDLKLELFEYLKIL